MMENIRLFVLDMDGLMFETGQLAYRSYLKAAEKYNFEVTPNVYYHLRGRNEEDIRDCMKKLYGSKVPTNDWRDSINYHKNQILAEDKRVYKKKGLVELLEFAKKKKIKVAVASSSSRAIVEYYLKIEKVSNYIDTIVAGDEVVKSKPEPEIFLKACKKSGVMPSEAIVFEDSTVGIEASQRAGIKSILIEDDITFMSSHHGLYKLKKDLSNLEKTIPYTEYKFMSLLEVNVFLNGLLK